MLVGQNNMVNEKLVKEISHVYPIRFMELKMILDHSEVRYSPGIILVNLMDVGKREEELIHLLKSRYPDRKIVGIHCFQSEKMIQRTLDKGYDSYLSIFNVSDEFSTVLAEQKLI